MKFKQNKKGNLTFKLIKAEYIKENIFQPKFKLGNDYFHSEDFGIEYFKSKGYDAFFAENKIWIELLIYLFNDELKRTPNHEPSLLNIYDYLYDDDFFNENKEKFLKRIDYLKNVDLVSEIKKNCSSPNFKVILLCSKIENNKILFVLFDLIQNFNLKKKGFPDLFVFNDDEAFLCEVKGNTDSLSYVQIKKHEVLLNAGIDIVIFAINKNESWVTKQNKRYFNDGYFRKNNFIDNYDSKIYIAKTVYEELIDEDIERFKLKFLNEYDLDIFMGFLNIIYNYSFSQKISAINSPSKELINQSIKKGNVIKKDRILKNGKVLEEKKKYLEAIDEYSKVNNLKAYKRIIYCYRALRDYENELNYIYNGINDSNFSKKEIRFFKRRLKRFYKNKNDYKIIKTNEKCPYCGGNIEIRSFYKRNKIKIVVCSNSKCYWYGGVLK